MTEIDKLLPAGAQVLNYSWSAERSGIVVLEISFSLEATEENEEALKLFVSESKRFYVKKWSTKSEMPPIYSMQFGTSQAINIQPSARRNIVVDVVLMMDMDNEIDYSKQQNYDGGYITTEKFTPSISPSIALNVIPPSIDLQQAIKESNDALNIMKEARKIVKKKKAKKKYLLLEDEP